MSTADWRRGRVRNAERKARRLRRPSGTQGLRHSGTQALGFRDIRYIDAPLLRDRDTDANGSLDETLHYCNDANMNVTALVNTSGTVVERYQYDPYGKVKVLNPDWSADEDQQSDFANEILYCGYRHDPETGLYHVRHRSYHPTLGRWLSRDPVGYVAGPCLYENVQSNPLIYADPYGLKEDTPWWQDTRRVPGYGRMTEEQRKSRPTCTRQRECYAQCVEFYLYCVNCRHVHYKDKSIGIAANGSDACLECLRTCLMSCHHIALTYNPCCIRGPCSLELSVISAAGKAAGQQSADQRVAEGVAEYAALTAAKAGLEATPAVPGAQQGVGGAAPMVDVAKGSAVMAQGAAVGMIGSYSKDSLVKGTEKGVWWLCRPENVQDYVLWHHTRVEEVPRDIRENKVRQPLP